MTITGFLFAAVGGYLVGLIGGSNQPISGLALSTLIIAALLMVAIGVTGAAAWRRCSASRPWSAARRRWPAT